MRLSSGSAANSGMATDRTVAKVAIAISAPNRNCVLKTSGIGFDSDRAGGTPDGGGRYMSKLIIFFMMKMPSPIQIAQQHSTMLPVDVVKSSEM